MLNNKPHFVIFYVIILVSLWIFQLILIYIYIRNILTSPEVFQNQIHCLTKYLMRLVSFKTIPPSTFKTSFSFFPKLQSNLKLSNRMHFNHTIITTKLEVYSDISSLSNTFYQFWSNWMNVFRKEYNIQLFGITTLLDNWLNHGFGWTKRSFNLIKMSS